jgi:hypothetical protein
MLPRRLHLALAALPLLAFLSGRVLAAAPDLSTLRVPPGFTIEVWADGVADARSMALGARGTLFVGSMKAGKVYAVRAAADGSRQVVTVAQGLKMPNGVAFRAGSLYVAETHRILRYDAIESKLDAPPEPVVIAQLPAEKWHGWRYIAFGPDDKLYVAIGAPCNACDRDREDFGTIRRMNPDGTGAEVVARGVRNSVGFAWHPRTRELWFTDNGRDLLGDDIPSCELNRLSRVGEHFGFPFCHGGDIADPEFGKLGRCSDSTPPVHKLGAHVAPLGVAFTPDAGWPEAWRNGVVVAEHGSWNRTEKSGYRVVHVALDGQRATGERVLASGWLDAAGKVTGRPVDVLFAEPGSLLVSDDLAGVIYRIRPVAVR